MVMTEAPETVEPNVQAHFKSLFTLHMLTPHWPKQDKSEEATNTMAKYVDTGRSEG